MTRNAVILAFVCTLAGVLFYSWNAEHKSNAPVSSRGPEETGSIVFATRDVLKGSPITTEFIEERVIKISQMPDHAACKLTDVLGRKAKYGLAKGYIVSLYDLDPSPPGLYDPVVRATRTIQKGAIIQAGSVEVVEMTHALADACQSSASVIGAKAKKEISAGEVLMVSDVDQSE